MVINCWSIAGFVSLSVSNRNQFVCGAEKKVQDKGFDSLKNKREGCFRAGSNQWRSALTSPAPTRHPAVRRPANRPVMCFGFGFDRSAVDPRLINRTASAPFSWLMTSGPMHFIFVDFFHVRHVGETQTLYGPMGSGRYTQETNPLFARLSIKKISRTFLRKQKQTKSH